MADRYTSLVALVVDRAVEDVGAVVQEAQAAGGIDRSSPVGSPREAAEVHWGGRMQKAVVRAVEAADGAPLLRVEAYVGGESVKLGMRRQAELLRALAGALGGRVRGVRDLSAHVEHDTAWLDRVAGGEVALPDAVHVHTEGQGTFWAHTHGAARFDVPDLELYGLTRTQIAPAEQVLRHLHQQLLGGGLKADLTLPDGTPVYLVPVLEAWGRLPLDWPGIGRAGRARDDEAYGGHPHEGPRATVSVLHRPRFGRYKRDLKGVLAHLR